MAGSRALTAGGLAFAAAFVVGCGTSQIKGGLSEGANSAISGDLSAVSDAVSDGSCAHAHTALMRLDTTLSQLPSATNAQLVKNLTQGASRVRALAVKECNGTSPPTTSTTSSSSTSATTSTTPTTPTTISAPTTSTTTTETQTQSETTPGTGSVTAFQSTTSGTSSNGGAGLSGGQ